MADFFDDQNNMEEDDDIITLYNEEKDVDEEFYHLATLDVDKRWFIVMKPVEKLDDIGDDEVLIYEILENDDGEDVFAPINDEALLNKVFDEFCKELDEAECGCGDECDCEEDCECGDKCDCEEDCDCGDKCECGEKSECADDCDCGCKDKK